MNAEQKLKWLILAKAAEYANAPIPEYPCEDIDAFFEKFVEHDDDTYRDAKETVRSSGIPTGLPAEWCRHYESESVAAQLPDGTWVGWTYWYGGGRHGEPEAVEWIDDAYDLECTEAVEVVKKFKILESE